MSTRVYDFTKIHPGVEFDGPAIIERPVTTIVVNPKTAPTWTSISTSEFIWELKLWQ